MSEKISFLIVDDNEDTCKSLGFLISSLNQASIPVECHFAATLKEAKRLTLEIQPHLTFLDLGLPDASVEEVISSIFEFKPPVIVVSGLPPDAVLSTGKELRVACLLGGAEDFLEKGSRSFFEAQERALKVILQKYNPHNHASSSI